MKLAQIKITRREALLGLCGVFVSFAASAKKASMNDIAKQIKDKTTLLQFTCGTEEWKFVRIPAGSFMMGSPNSEALRETEEPTPFSVTITQPFYMAQTLVTEKQFASVDQMPREPAAEMLPVDQIRYEEALSFTHKLGGTIGANVTLPTEAQWEYACRAGTATPIYSGASASDLDRIAWYRENSDEKRHPVGQKEPNAWGLYDMIGNIFEPCIDMVGDFKTLPHKDPKGPVFPDRGTMRGGGFMSSETYCRAAARMHSNNMFGGMGIRPIITV